MAGRTVFICDECVELCNDIIREEIKGGVAARKDGAVPTPPEICQHLDAYVIGQNTAKRALSVAVHTNYKRFANSCRGDDVEQAMPNSLPVCTTGSREISLAQTIDRDTAVPITAAPATYSPVTRPRGRRVANREV